MAQIELLPFMYEVAARSEGKRFNTSNCEEKVLLRQKMPFLTYREVILFSTCVYFANMYKDEGGHIVDDEVLLHLGYKKHERDDFRPVFDALLDLHLLEYVLTDGFGAKHYVLSQDVLDDLKCNDDPLRLHCFYGGCSGIFSDDIDNMLRHGERGYAIISFPDNTLTRSHVSRKIREGQPLNHTIIYDKDGNIVQTVVYLETYVPQCQIAWQNLTRDISEMCQMLHAPYLLCQQPDRQSLEIALREKCIGVTSKQYERYFRRIFGEILWK